MTKEQVTKKLKALKALAEQGVGGEKEDARRLYEKLKNKYGISEKELRQEPKDPQEKQFDGDTLFQAATAEIMLKAEQEECESCGTYENIQRLCLQLEKLSRQRKGKGQQA